MACEDLKLTNEFPAAGELTTSNPFSFVAYPRLQPPAAAPSNAEFVADALESPRGMWWTQLISAEPSHGILAGLWKDTLIYSALITDTTSIQLAATERGREHLEFDLPSWTSEALARLFSQQALPVGWDSYGGLPVADEHAREAWRFLERFMTDALPLPDFVPLTDGGLQLEWDADGTHVSFTSDEESSPTVWFTTGDESHEVRWDDVPNVLEQFRRRTRAGRQPGA